MWNRMGDRPHVFDLWHSLTAIWRRKPLCRMIFLLVIASDAQKHPIFLHFDAPFPMFYRLSDNHSQHTLNTHNHSPMAYDHA